MRGHIAISRRHMLEMASATGAVAAFGKFAPAKAAAAAAAAGGATPQRVIEQLDPALANIIEVNQPITELATGYGAGVLEGPVWIKEGGYLLFEHVRSARRIKYTPGKGAEVVLENNNQANGLTRDPQGRIVSCEHLTRRVVRFENDGSVTVVANSYQGKQLLQPNDVIVKSDGSIYLTDLGGPNAPENWAVEAPAVYRVSPDLGSVTLVTNDLVSPNGLAFSPDERILYIGDSRRRQVIAFDVLAQGTLARATSRVFVDLGGQAPGGPDGMKVDMAGNLYTGGSGGLYIISPQGKKLGRIVHGDPGTTNLAFGGDDWKTLYFTTATTLYSVNLKGAGVPVPRGKVEGA